MSGFAIRAGAPKQNILVQNWRDAIAFPLDGGSGNGRGGADVGNKQREVFKISISRELPNRTLWIGAYHNVSPDSWFVRMRFKFWLGGTIITETDLDFGWSIAELKVADPDYKANFYLTIAQPGNAAGTPPYATSGANEPFLYMLSGTSVPAAIPPFDLHITADAISLEIVRFSNSGLWPIVYGLSILSQSETL